MATGGLYGASPNGNVVASSGSETSGLYGNSSVFGGTYFEYLIFIESTTVPATPTGGSWSFTTNTGTPPTGWSNTPPASPTNPVYLSIALVNSRGNGALTWSVPGQIFKQGAAATIAAGTTTTGASGTSASVTNVGTSSAAVFNFVIPRGDKGDAATVAAGTTTTGAAGTSASVTNSGTSSAAVFNFTIPRGNAGVDSTVAAGTTTTGAAGTSASVTNSGTPNAAVFNFTIPRGDKGDAATVAAGTTTTGAAGTSASVTNSGTSSAAVFNFTIPRGDTGATGAGVPTGGTTGQVLSKINATDYNTQWITPNAGTVTAVTATAPVLSSLGATPNISLTTSGANSVVVRDANQNITSNSINEGFSNVAAAGTTTVLTAASAPNYVVTGSGGQTYQLPDATTLIAGTNYTFNNNQSSGTIVVKNNSSTTVATVQSGGFVELILLSNSVAAGSWDLHNFAPSNVSWSTNTFDYAGSITSATWNGNAVAYNRGGTGQSSAFVAGGIVYGATTTSLAVTAAGTAGQVLTSAGAGVPVWSNASTGTVTSVAALTLGTTGTDLSSSVATGTTTPVITLNVPTASATNRGVLSSTDWTTFNNKQAALVSGTNIKTVASNSLLGSGNISFDSLTPSQTSNAGKFLTTDGTSSSWSGISGGTF
jgi:hypothetical protein